MTDLENLISTANDTKLKLAQEEGRRLAGSAFQFQASTMNAERKTRIMKAELEKAMSIITALRTSNKAAPHESC